MQSIPAHCAGRTILHLGSGRNYEPGAVSIDLVPAIGPDIVHNLDVRPWSVPDDFCWLSSFDDFTGHNDLGFCTDQRFRTLKAEIVFYRSLVNKAIWRLARRSPVRNELRYAWMFPAWFLSFEHALVKSASQG